MFCSNMQCWVFLKLSKMRQFFQGHIIIVTWKMQCYSNKVLMAIMVHYRNIFYIELQFWKFEAHFSLTLNSTNSIWIYCKNVISWVFSLDGWRCRGVGSATSFKFSHSPQTAMTWNHPGGDTDSREGDDTPFTTLELLYYLWRGILLKWLFSLWFL